MYLIWVSYKNITVYSTYCKGCSEYVLERR